MDEATEVRKARLRRDLLQMRNNLPEGERWRRSERIHTHLRATDAWRDATTVAFYVSIGSEVDTRDALPAACAEKRVVAPATDLAAHRITLHEVQDPEALEPGAFGVPEPAGPIVDPGEVDLVLVPGLAFDPRGNRVGYGAGYYDGLLAEVACPTAGLAYAFQVVDEVPATAHDVPVAMVVTEDGVRSARS